MQINRDATGYTPPSFEALPSAWYPIQMIEGLETPSSKNKANTYYAAIFEVVDGPFKGRRLFTNFNFVNTNEKAVEIAYDHLDQIMSAVGVLKITDMSQLFNKPLMGKVKLVPAEMEDDGVSIKYDPKNELKAYKPLESGVTTAAAGAAIGGDGLPEGFAAAVEHKPAAGDAAAAAIPSTAKTPIPSAAKAEPVKVLVMTDKLPGVTAAQFRETDAAWTDQKLVEEGYAKWVLQEPEAPAVPKPSAIPTATTAAEQATSTPTPTSDAAVAGDDDDDTPPWLAEGQA